MTSPCSLFGTLALALFSSPAGLAPLPDGPRVLFEAADGTVEERELERLRVTDPRKDGAYLLRFLGLEPIRLPSVERAEIDLVAGDRLRAEVTGGEGELLKLRLLGEVAFNLRVDSLESLRFPDRIPEGWGGSLESADEGDRLYRRTHSGLDRIDGTLVEFSKEGLVLDGVLGEKLFPWSEVAALFVEVFEEEEDGGREGDVPVVLDLIDSSRLAGALVELDELTCKLRVGEETLTFPTWALAELFVDDGTLTFLSDLAPTAVDERSPFGDELGMTWPYRVDRSVTGEPLQAGGQRFTRGLGVHAPSRLTWKLEGPWTKLRGKVAVDDQVKRLPARGSVIFRVSVNGEQVWESRELHGGDPPVSLPELEFEPGAEISLEVDMASDFHVADRADWLRLLLS